MTAEQRKVVSIILMVLGGLVVVTGLYEALMVYQVNVAISDMDQMMGGMMGEFAGNMGTDVRAGYGQSIMMLVFGSALAFWGFTMLGQNSQTASST